MDYDSFNAIQKIDFYQKQEDSSDPFTRVIQMIANRTRSGQNHDEFVEQYVPLLDKIPVEDLAQDNGILLLTASDKGMPSVISYLVDKTQDWTQDVLEACLTKTAAANYPNTTRSILDGMQDIRKDTFLTAYKTTTHREIRNALDKYKQSKIGSNWKINEDYEIQRVNTSPKIITVFNFAACHVTTIIPNTTAGANDTVTCRDFQDLQNDGELVIAYNKLAMFSNNAPAYNGKDFKAQRRVSKRHKGASQ